MPESRCRKLSAVRSAVRMEASGPLTLATWSPSLTRVPSATSEWYSEGGLTSSKTLAAALVPEMTPALRAMRKPSPMSLGSTTASVVMSTPSSPRSSSRAFLTRRSRSGFDKTIGLLAQAERLLGEAEKVGALAAHVALLAGRFDHAAIDDLAPEVAAVDRKSKHRLVDVLQLGDGELRRQQLEADRGGPDLAAQPSYGVINDLAVVERHLDRQKTHGVPLLLTQTDPRLA